MLRKRQPIETVRLQSNCEADFHLLSKYRCLCCGTSNFLKGAYDFPTKSVWYLNTHLQHVLNYYDITLRLLGCLKCHLAVAFFGS